MNSARRNLSAWFSDHRLKIINTIVAVILGVAAIWQYRDAKENEFKQAYYENEIRVVNEVYDAMYHLDIATTDEDKRKAAKEFWKIWYGDGRTYLTPNTFHYLRYTADYINSCVTKIRPVVAGGFPCSVNPELTISGFASAARQDLSTAWKVSFTQINETDPWLSETTR